MGRRPNALILQYFERGPKLQDQSNRYPHTCKSCGEHFPRGRIDSLTAHLTKRCPAISQEDRLNAFMALSGMTHASHRIQHGRNGQPQAQAQAQAQAHFHDQPSTAPVDVPTIQGGIERDWSKLSVLAEVSRQIEQNEKSDVPVSSTTATGQAGPPTNERSELQDQYAGDSTSSVRDAPGERPVDSSLLREGAMSPTAEERLQEALRVEDESVNSSNLTMAAAAAARLQPTLLDPQLLGDDAAAAAAAEAASATVAAALAGSLPPIDQSSSAVLPPLSIATSQPWGEITYTSEGFQTQPLPAEMPHHMIPLRGGYPLEPNAPSGVRARHSRAKFDPTRRKQVQEVRKIGACIRCRVLRKTCSQGQPCDTCRKVLSPRVWRSGCVRTKFAETLDLYTAGVQVVLAQARINTIKQAATVTNNRLQIVARQFNDKESRLELQVLQVEGALDLLGKQESVDSAGNEEPFVIIDNDTQDVPARVEAYMREALPDLIKEEPSNFMQVTLETAQRIAQGANDELLKKSLELYGLVELLSRERQWHIYITTGIEEQPYRLMRLYDTNETFNTICLQLAAAAERKAVATSKALLTGMQRVLQDSKVKIDFNMYYAALILLNCVEKSTWSFKAWEQDNLRNIWPLEKNPGDFTDQGYVIANLLRMLLGIRKALPRTMRRESDGKLITDEQDPVLRDYFEAINLGCKFSRAPRPCLFSVDDVKAIQEQPMQPIFSPTDPRSLELLFCSTLLLPVA
ncbi:hypothetical protein V8F06_010484 [Rhypophila decipiens]